MRAVIVTQEEPFYLPLFLSKVLTEYKGIIAVILLPGTPHGFNFLSYIKRLYDVFGLRDFLAYGALFIRHKCLAFFSRWKQFQRFYSVGAIARMRSIPVYQLKNINTPDSLNLLRTLKPEAIISVAAPQVFGKELISLARHTINIHAALLPQYRGMMPGFWVLAKGEDRTGVTVHYVDEHLDTGDIILQEAIDISPRDTLHSLQTKVANVGAATLLQALQRMEKGESGGISIQGEGSYYPFPTREAAGEFRRRGRRFI